MNERLQLKNDAPIESQPTHCPGCGAPLGMGAVICLQCGYDTRTGRRLSEGRRNRIKPLILAGMSLAAVGGLAILLPRFLSPALEDQSIAPVVRAPADAPPVTATTPEPAGIHPTTTSPAVVQSMPSTHEPAAVSTNAEEKPAIDWAEVEAEQRMRAEEELDLRLPMLSANEAAELRLTNGLVYRGRFLGLVDGEVKIESDDSGSRTLAAASLDRASRLRVDRTFREGYLDFHVRQRLLKLKQASTNAP